MVDFNLFCPNLISVTVKCHYYQCYVVIIQQIETIGPGHIGKLTSMSQQSGVTQV